MADNITLKYYINTLQQKGNLAYEYNPFRNYQTDVDLYIIDTNVGKILVPEGKAVSNTGNILTKKTTVTDEVWTDDYGIIYNQNQYTKAENGDLWAKAGSLIDFDTDQLNFDLEHPVDIEVQPSYDGSVNLILNDDKNIPRLINSRFSVREKNTYEIVDRIGENDTNIYNSKSFDKDTSLYFQYEQNPIINYLGFIRGTFAVGQYCFYLTYCDADDNESDYIAESGLIPVFLGNDKDPFSMDGGIKNQFSDKGVRLRIDNLDKSYNYLKVYYVRYFADYQQNRVYEAKKIYKKYPINSNQLYLQITGYEEAEDIDANILNISRFNPKSILTQAQCKNMLFFGNIVKNSDNYKELQDCALRITPSIITDTISDIDYNYESNTSLYGYYNSKTVYDKTGYFKNEYYRFGVVFIYQNGTLSNVYNVLGGDLSLSITNNLGIYDTSDNVFLKRNYIKVDDKGWIYPNDQIAGTNLNAKGVCYFNTTTTENENTVYGVKFNIPTDTIKYLKEELGIRGLFFVRQKCVPNILAQCYIMPFDKFLESPVLKYENKYKTECFIGNDRLIKNDYEDRLYTYEHTGDSENSISNNAYAAICPDFLLNQPYYNQIFNGGQFKLQKITDNSTLVKQNNKRRIYNNSISSITNDNLYKQVYISTVTEDVPTVALKNQVYRLEIGQAEESFRFKYAEVDNGKTSIGNTNYEDVDKATNLVRGKYSPYLAIYSTTSLSEGEIYNIYQSNSISITQEYQNRMDSYEPFYAISDRYNFEKLDNIPYTDDEINAINNSNLTTDRNDREPGTEHYIVTYKEGYTPLESGDLKEIKSLICWRGDCYINTFTYRLNRNFNDPSLPNNDQIIDPNTWKDNYKSNNPEKWADISRSDINAVQLGSWITIKVKSAMNYALRSVDHSYVSEEALMGAPRSFYPRSQLLYRGENKMPDSYLYNDAYRASLGFKCYFALHDINYIKDSFSNRIQYSAISIQDSFKNNYRYSLSTYFRDYSQEYGSITRLISFEGYLLVVFEHAVCIAVINERVIAGTGDGEPVFINTNNVLPEELTVISDTYGTQWSESVVKSEAGYVYGVDTVAKKIWRVKGQEIEILSDFKVNKFLIDNLTLGERELTPIIGLRNVKTHYNNNKKDIMFTFYDDIHEDEEKVWNLCYNELIGEFITFYSWVPSYSENIDTQFFSFNRDTSKYLTLIDQCNYNNPNNYGVVVDSPILKNDGAGGLYKKEEYKCNTDPYYAGYTIYLDSQLPVAHVGCYFIQRASKRLYEDTNLTATLEYTGDTTDTFNYIVTDTNNGIDVLEYNSSNVRTGTISDIESQIYIDDTNNPEPGSHNGKYIIVWKNDFLSSDKKIIKRLFYSGTNQAILYYVCPNNRKTVTYTILNEDGTTSLRDISLDTQERSDGKGYILPEVKFRIEKDHWGNYTYVGQPDNNNCIGTATVDYFRNNKVMILYVTPYLETLNVDLNEGEQLITTNFPTEMIVLTLKSVLENPLLTGEDKNEQGLTTDFYLHGNSGIFNVAENLYPTHWYGEYHPFEFEFIVNDKIGQQKIFNDLILISNKAEPESFHFEIEGDNYEFSSDKRTMYFRQEATKNLFQNLGSNILYDRYFTDVAADPYTHEQYYRSNPVRRDGNNLPTNTNYTDQYRKFDKVYPLDSQGLIRQVKSTIFPLYYNRVDTYNQIYHSYTMMNGDNYDFKNLSGSEIKWNRDLNQFNIVTHIKNSPIDHYGRLRGNSRYKEGKWHIQIPSISFMQKNETSSDWVQIGNSNITNYGSPLKSENIIPPIVINTNYLPTDLTDSIISIDKLPNIYSKFKENNGNGRYTTSQVGKYVSVSNWTYRKETKIRDKFIKIRVRYSGKNLAIIHSIVTLYNVSYS